MNVKPSEIARCVL